MGGDDDERQAPQGPRPAGWAAWGPPGPAAGRRTDLTVIHQDLPELDIRRLFEAATNALLPDAADPASLRSNPLAIPGRAAN